MDFGLIQDFVNCVIEGREPSITGYGGLESLKFPWLHTNQMN